MQPENRVECSNRQVSHGSLTAEQPADGVMDGIMNRLNAPSRFGSEVGTDNDASW